MQIKENKLFKYFFLGVTGGSLYCCIELLWRHWTDASMFFVAFLLFIIIGGLNQWSRHELSFLKQMLLGAVIVTFVEFIAGIILNFWLKLDIWDYSSMPLNLMGQVCLPYSVLWFFLCGFIILADDYIRWKFFGEEKKHYTF